MWVNFKKSIIKAAADCGGDTVWQQAGVAAKPVAYPLGAPLLLRMIFDDRYVRVRRSLGSKQG